MLSIVKTLSLNNKLRHCWTHIVRNKSKIAFKSTITDGPFRLRDVENIDNEHMEDILEDEIHEEMSGLQNPKSRHFWQRQEKEQDRLRLKKQIQFRKSYPKEPNLLTWAAKWQIKQLNRQYPDEWTPEKLADHFPLTQYTIKKVIKNNILALCEEDIIKHDNRVHKNWLAVQKSIENYIDGQPVDPIHEFLLSNKKLQLMVNAAGVAGKPYPNVKDLVTPSIIETERQTRQGGQFLSIIQSYNKQLTEQAGYKKVNGDVGSNQGTISSDTDNVKLLSAISKGQKTEDKSDYHLKSSKDDKINQKKEATHAVIPEIKIKHKKAAPKYMHMGDNTTRRTDGTRDRREISKYQGRPKDGGYRSTASSAMGTNVRNFEEFQRTKEHQIRNPGRKTSSTHDHRGNYKGLPRQGTDYSHGRRDSNIMHSDYNKVNRRTQENVMASANYRPQYSNEDTNEGESLLESIRILPKHDKRIRFDRTAKEVYDKSGELLYVVP